MSQWEIRSIQAKSASRTNYCSKGVCLTPATHYLVLLPEPGILRRRESRSRRCEKHAREDSQSLGIAFPEKDGAR